MKPSSIRATLIPLVLALVTTSRLACADVPEIKPGDTYQFSQADGGGTQCRTATGIPADTTLCGTLTTYDAAQRFVRAVFDANLLTAGLGEAHYSTAWVYNDFAIPGAGTNVVDAQVSVNCDYYGILFAAGAFKSSGTLSLEIEDRTAGRVVSSTTIFQQERDGDQGFTDLAIGQELQYPRGESASLQVKLQRGHTYRIKFSLETLAEEFAIGRIVTSASASWSKLYVVISPDQAEQLRQHDADIKAALAAHDTQIKAALATHDADIKAALAAHDATMKAALAKHDADIKAKLDQLDGKLTDINAKLDEIKILLLTPQGRRPGFPNK